MVVFLGPNAPVGHGSVLPIIEHATKYIIKMMKKIQYQNIKAVSPSISAHMSLFPQKPYHREVN